MAQQPTQGNQGGSQGSLTQRTTQSGSTTNSNSPGQGGGGQDNLSVVNDSMLPATGSRKSVAQSNPSSNSNQNNQDISESFDNDLNHPSARRGQGNELNFQGNEDMGIYMAIPSSETPGKYVEFDNLSADGAHELTGMYKRSQLFSGNINNVLNRSEDSEQNINQASNSTYRPNSVGRIGGETEKTAEFGHSGIPGKSLAPPEEDGRKTSPIRGGRLEGERELGKL